MKKATITVTLVVLFDDNEDPLDRLEEACTIEHGDPIIIEVIEPHVDAVEDYDEGDDQ